MNEREIINLNGDWNFALDPDGTGNWYGSDTGLPNETLKVPGSWEEQGIGSPSSNEPIGAWKKIREYEGTGWYVKHIQIPENIGDAHFYLVLSGARWHTKVWIDGMEAGEQESLATEHRFDLSSLLHPGQTHRLAIFVDNRMKLRLGESHIHSYQTATAWGGITGGIHLEVLPAVHIADINVSTDGERKTADFAVTVSSSQNKLESYQVIVDVYDHERLVTSQKSSMMDTEKDGAQLIIQVSENLENWSDINPNLYTAQIYLKEYEQTIDQTSICFGIRSICTNEKQLLLNGSPVFLRGYADCCIFPLTGYPSWDVDFYRQQFRTAKEYGFNHVRLHSWNPPKPFWQAADEEGMLIQTELPHWTTFYHNRGQMVDNEEHHFLQRELIRIIKSLNSHPSFMMLSLGNELVREDGHPELNKLVRLARAEDSSRLYTDNTGFGQLPAFDREGDFYTPTLNFHPPFGWDDTASPDTTKDYKQVTALASNPLIAHEHGQYSMYIRPQEAAKYKGIMEPSFLTTTLQTLKKRGLIERIDEFIEATGTHLVRSLKENFKRMRRTSGLSGFQWLDIRDFPGQGHATTGILDMFWDSKGLIEPEQFIRFNADIVLLMRTESRVLYCGDIASIQIDLSNFGHNAIKQGVLTWTLQNKERSICSGEINIKDIKSGSVSCIAHLSIPIPNTNASHYTLDVSLMDTKGQQIGNDWSFWCIPRPLLHSETNQIWTDISSMRSTLFGAIFSDKMKWVMGGDEFKPEKVKLVITDQLNTLMVQHLVDGGRVWLMAKPDQQHDEVSTRYLPMFWNYLLFIGMSGNTLGMINHPHPSLGKFPHDRYSDWQWYNIVNGIPAIGLDLLPQLSPIVEVVDTFHRGKRLAYALELKVGKGKLYISTFRFRNEKDMKRPENAFLFQEILSYLMSDNFDPSEEVSVGELVGLFKLKANW